MVFGDSLTKAGRLVELQLLFWRNPGSPLSTSQLADRLHIAPRTVRKYLTELSAAGRLPIYRDRRGWRLMEQARLEVAPVRFALEEAAALFLAVRLLERHADEPNAAVSGAVAKLGAAIPGELRPAFDHLVSRADSESSEGAFSSVFRTMAYGWALQREVEIEYLSRSTKGVVAGTLRPYLLEPSAVGSAIYAIGSLSPPGKIRVLKLERIAAAHLTDDTFEAPPVSQLIQRLDQSWGVWISDEQPIDVCLIFSADVARRVRETRWHPSQKLKRKSEGRLEMKLTVSSTIEILPWVLGWGRQVEVVAPDDLRDLVANEHLAAAAAYE
jgi:CRISPR-associated endonuclease/helicase Cas3